MIQVVSCSKPRLVLYLTVAWLMVQCEIYTFIVLSMEKHLYDKGCWIETLWKANSSCYSKGKHQRVSHLCSASLPLRFPVSFGRNAILQQSCSADPGEANVSFPDGKLPTWRCRPERRWGNSLRCRSKRASLPNTPRVHAPFTAADEVARKSSSSPPQMPV